MKYRILISDRAMNDITNALNYIEGILLNPQAADDLSIKIEQRIESLATMPKRHPVIDDPLLSRLGMRFIVIDGYIAFYTISNDIKTVNIIRIVYGKRNWSKLLGDLPTL